MATSRFAHYLKVIARDKIGSFMEADGLRGVAGSLDSQLRQRRSQAEPGRQGPLSAARGQGRGQGDSGLAGHLQRRRLAAAVAAAGGTDDLAADGGPDSPDRGLNSRRRGARLRRPPRCFRLPPRHGPPSDPPVEPCLHPAVPPTRPPPAVPPVEDRSQPGRDGHRVREALSPLAAALVGHRSGRPFAAGRSARPFSGRAVGGPSDRDLARRSARRSPPATPKEAVVRRLNRDVALIDRLPQRSAQRHPAPCRRFRNSKRPGGGWRTSSVRPPRKATR